MQLFQVEHLKELLYFSSENFQKSASETTQ